MIILVCPDSFKGSLQSWEVSVAIRRDLERIDRSFRVIEKPLADGGEGTVEAIVLACRGRFFSGKLLAL